MTIRNKLLSLNERRKRINQEDDLLHQKMRSRPFKNKFNAGYLPSIFEKEYHGLTHEMQHISNISTKIHQAVKEAKRLLNHPNANDEELETHFL